MKLFDDSKDHSRYLDILIRVRKMTSPKCKLLKDKYDKAMKCLWEAFHVNSFSFYDLEELCLEIQIMLHEDPVGDLNVVNVSNTMHGRPNVSNGFHIRIDMFLNKVSKCLQYLDTVEVIHFNLKDVHQPGQSAILAFHESLTRLKKLKGVAICFDDEMTISDLMNHDLHLISPVELELRFENTTLIGNRHFKDIFSGVNVCTLILVADLFVGGYLFSTFCADLEYIPSIKVYPSLFEF